jgi:hypothetical protein
MKFKSIAARATVTTSVLVLFGVGCGSSAGGGCGGLKPLPSAPAPLGIPSDQVIEGGAQVRITKPGMDKLIGAVVNLISGDLKNGLCIAPISDSFGITCFNVDVGLCNNSMCQGAKGCAASVVFTSADGKDKITASISEGANPTVSVDAKFDVSVPLELDYGGELFCASANGSCTLQVDSAHFDDASKAPLEIAATINTGIDPTTGELTLTLGTLNVVNIGINATGCSVLGDILNTVLSGLNSDIGKVLTNFIIGLLNPQLNSLIQSFLPKPPGLAGTLDTASLLSSFDAPAGAGLETFVVAGGYVAGKGGGLNLGIMSGMNSDADPTTRTPGLTSEPSLCVPVRPTPQLGQMPWMLPANPARKDFLLSPANEFSGMPDPTDPMGNVQDVAIGLSRTFLDLAGFHVYNSGTLCLDIGGSAIPQLNSGTLSVIVGSLGNIIEDRKAPLELVLRPQTPLTFTVGAGDMTDPLLHIGISDMRIDFYAWVEERFVRLLTMAVDINVGLNLTITKDANGNAAVAPMLVGVDANNVTIRISNTDLLQETPDALAAVFPSLINIATGALGGVIKPITLPSVAGFSLDNLSIQRVQTAQDDFVDLRHHHHRHAGAAHRLVEPGSAAHHHGGADQRGHRRGQRADAEPAAGELRRRAHRRRRGAPDGEAGARRRRQRRPRGRVRLAHRRRHVAPVDAGREPRVARGRVRPARSPQDRRALARRQRLVDRVGAGLARRAHRLGAARAAPGARRRRQHALRLRRLRSRHRQQQAHVRVGPARRVAQQLHADELAQLQRSHRHHARRRAADRALRQGRSRQHRVGRVRSRRAQRLPRPLDRAVDRGLQLRALWPRRRLARRPRRAVPGGPGVTSTSREGAGAVRHRRGASVRRCRLRLRQQELVLDRRRLRQDAVRSGRSAGVPGQHLRLHPRHSAR